MFESVVTKLVKAIGSDTYLPSSSVTSSEELFPLSLVERKASRWYFGRNSYYPTEFKLSDVLQATGTPFKTELEPEKDLCGFSKNAVLKVNGKLAGHFKSLFDAELDNADSITVKADLGDLHQVEVDQQSLLNNIKSRQINLTHELMRELSAKDRRALCVVVGVIKTTKETTIIASLNVKFDADAKVSVPVAGGEVKGDVEEDKGRTLTLPAGTVLAYQVQELAIDKKGLFRVMVSYGAKGGFNCSSQDETDARPTSDMFVGKENVCALYNGLSLMTAEDRRGVLERVKNLCVANQLIDDLALCLRTSARSQNADVQATLDLISRQPHADQASSAVLSLTRALRNMDAELLCDVSTLSADQVHFMSSVLSACQSKATLARGSELVTSLLSRTDLCPKLLLDDLMFNLNDSGLSYSTSNSILVNSAYMVFYALDMIN